MGLNYITALEIATCDPKLRYREVGKLKEPIDPEKPYGGVLYMMRDGHIHKSWFDFEGFSSKEEADKWLDRIIAGCDDWFEKGCPRDDETKDQAEDQAQTP